VLSEPTVEIHSEAQLEPPGVVFRLELDQIEEPNIL
jgi:hypothetical protein